MPTQITGTCGKGFHPDVELEEENEMSRERMFD